MTPGSTCEARIVAACDGSRAGMGAVAMGRTLAEATGATLAVADVFAYNALFGPTVTLDPAMEAGLTRVAEQRLRRIEEALAGFDRWTYHMRAALPAAAALQALAEEQRAQLIVVAGSPLATARRLLSEARVPVAVTAPGRRNGRPPGIHWVGVGFDGSAGAARALSAAAALAGATGAALRVVAATRLRSELWQRLDEVVAALPAVEDIDLELVDDDPVEGLCRVSAPLDLLVVGPDRGGALLRRGGSALLVLPGGRDDPLESLVAPLTATRRGAHAA